MRVLFGALLFAALVLTVTAAETDISGRWTGTFAMNGPDGASKDTSALLILKQSGSDITGTVGPSEEEQYPIAKGRIEGDRITLEVQHDEHAIKFDLMLADGRIKGNAAMSGGEGPARTAKLDVGRAK